MKTTRINLLLGASLILLVLLIGSGQFRQTAVSLPLTDLDPAQLHSLRIADGKGRNLVFVHEAGRWRMVEPTQGPADGRKLAALAKITQAPSFRRFAVSQVDSAELGFSKPPLRLVLDDQALEFGGTEPIRQRRYVKVGHVIHLIEDRFQHYLLAGARDFIVPASSGTTH